jgi:ElaB/YqjD/DUF883 family membrane-anchored ribosome-binding protein
MEERKSRMAARDADMPPAPGLEEDLKHIKAHIASLRDDLETLAGDAARVGHHQLDRMQSTANAAAAEFAEVVRRNPLSTLAIAAGVGFLYGVLTRR